MGGAQLNRLGWNRYGVVSRPDTDGAQVFENLSRPSDVRRRQEGECLLETCEGNIPVYLEIRKDDANLTQVATRIQAQDHSHDERANSCL